MQSLLNEPDSTAWNQIAPLLDEALSGLGEKEYDAVVLRFFDGKELKNVGAAMGTTEDAARMRVNRGVEKLRDFFTKKGVTLSVTAIAGAVAANSVQAAPVGLATAITTTALSATTITTAAVIAATKTAAMTTLQKTIIGAALAAAVAAGVYEAYQAAKARAEVQTLQQQQSPLTDQIQQLQHERDDTARQLASLSAENERLNRNTGELLRLRGEVGLLRRQSDELRLLRDKDAQVQQAPQIENNSSNSLPTVAKLLVTHIGQPQDVSGEQIRTNISIKVGDIYDRMVVSNDVRKLSGTGLFQNIRVADSTSDEGVKLNYLVQEKPKISNIRFAGNTRFQDVDLAELLSSKVANSLDERKLSDDAQRIQELYVKSGLSDPKVKLVYNVNEEVGLGEVVFEIAE